MIEFKYRPDVDGLRAVAVALVLLFHAGLGFSGGFIGVDVFFVISGFLITGLILKEQEAGEFSLATFWVRRIRRIIPAATAMVVVVLVSGFVLLIPSDYMKLGQSAIAQQLMLSNVYFWRHTGYFDGSADFMPLLHTWSLAVEEQFYLGYPLLLMFLRRFGHGRTGIALSLIAVVSLVLSQYGVGHHRSATFFLLPTRAWELLMGGLICFLPQPTRIQPRLLAAGSWLALGAIVAAGWWYDSGTPFPGLAALVPCVSAAVLIYANSIGLTFPAKILATRPVVLAGLMSYSLYLWHWPVLAYLRYWFGTELPAWIGVGALSASVILAFLSWRFVETPFRRGYKSRAARVPVMAALCSGAALSLVGFLIVGMAGFPSRLSAEARKFLETPGTRLKVARTLNQWQNWDLPVVGTTTRPIENVDFLLWGDSLAGVTADLVDKLALEYGLRGVIASQPATAPVPGVYNAFSARQEQLGRSDAIMRFVQKLHPKHVILVANWQLYESADGRFSLKSAEAGDGKTGSGRELLSRKLRELCEALSDLNVRVWIVKRVPLQRIDPRTSLAASTMLSGGLARGISLNEHMETDAATNAELDALAGDFDNVTIIDPASSCFDAEGWSRIGDQDGSFYRDLGHVSIHGATTLLMPVLRPVFESMATADESSGSAKTSD